MWVIYCDCMTLHFKSWHGVSHLTSTTIPQAYIIKGDINSLTPDEWWAWEEEEAMDMIGLPVPDDVFMAIKDNTTTMDAWNAMKISSRTTLLWSEQISGRSYTIPNLVMRKMFMPFSTVSTLYKDSSHLWGQLTPTLNMQWSYLAPLQKLMSVLGGLNAVAHTSDVAITSS